MHGKEKDVAQPPAKAGVASNPISITPIASQNNAHLQPPQHALPRMQSQTQVPAAIPGRGNGQPRMHAQQNPVSLPQWQSMQQYLQNAQMGYYSQPVPPLANFRPPSATAPATAAPRNPPHSSVLIGNRTNNPDVPIYGTQHGVSVAQPSTVAEYLSLTGNRTHSVPFNHRTHSARPEQHHLQQMYREMYARQLQGIAIHQQQQRQQQQQHPQLVLPLIPPPPLPPPPPELLGTQFFMQRPPPSAPQLHELPRLPPLLPLSNALHPLIHSRFHSGNNNIINNNTTVAAAPPVFVPQNNPLQFNTNTNIAAPVFVPQNNPLQVPQEPEPVAPTTVAPTAPRPPVHGSAPDTARNVPVINVVAADVFPLINPVGGGGDSDAGLLLPPDLQDPLSLEAHSKHMVYVHDYLLHLQDQHADYEQQKLLEGMRSLPIPDEIQKQINSSAAAATAALIPIGGVPGVAFQDQVDVSMEEEEDDALVQTQNAAEKARKEQLKQERRKEQNASNKRKQRQRLREEEEAEWYVLEQAYRKTKDELLYLNKDNCRLIVAIIVRVRVLVVRDAMLGVFHPLLSARKLLQPQIESASIVEASPPIVETNPPGIECDNLVQNTTNAADPLLIINPLAAARDGSPPPTTIPTPSPLAEQQLDLNQQVSVFEINKSLAHVDPEACISYTRQLLVDIAHQVAVAFEDKLPAELVALIENSVIESREVYKRVLEENKDIYYAHISQLTGNAIVAATKSKKAAAIVLDQGVTKIQLLELRKAEREFTTTDADARSRLHAAQLEIHQLLQRMDRAMASVAGPSHSALPKNNAEVAACVDKWERFSHIRQNLIVQLEESFFEVRLYANFILENAVFVVLEQK
jgi:hypothetical protein